MLFDTFLTGKQKEKRKKITERERRQWGRREDKRRVSSGAQQGEKISHL